MEHSVYLCHLFLNSAVWKRTPCSCCKLGSSDGSSSLQLFTHKHTLIVVLTCLSLRIFCSFMCAKTLWNPCILLFAMLWSHHVEVWWVSFIENQRATLNPGIHISNLTDSSYSSIVFQACECAPTKNNQMTCKYKNTRQSGKITDVKNKLLLLWYVKISLRYKLSIVC